MTKPKARHDHREPSRAPAAPPAPVERAYVITVALTAREITALVGQRNSDELPVAVCVTSADSNGHRVNFAESALKKFKTAVQQQRP